MDCDCPTCPCPGCASSGRNTRPRAGWVPTSGSRVGSTRATVRGSARSPPVSVMLASPYAAMPSKTVFSAFQSR